VTRNELLLRLRRNVANNVRYYRHQQGFSQHELAQAAGLSSNTIYLLESTGRQFSLSLMALASAAHACQVDVADLLADREDQPNPRGKTAEKFLQRKRDAANHAHPQ
jgi:transcriptional regulator with XRE-family HTH domain